MKTNNKNVILLAIAVFGIMAVTATLNNVVYASRPQVLDNVTCYNCTFENASILNSSLAPDYSILNTKSNKSGDTFSGIMTFQNRIVSSILTATNFLCYTPAGISTSCSTASLSVSQISSLDAQLLSKRNKTDEINLTSNFVSTGKTFNTDYWNNYSFPIYIELNISVGASAGNKAEMWINKNNSQPYYFFGTANQGASISTFIPGNTKYNLTTKLGGTSTIVLNSWVENNLSLR